MTTDGPRFDRSLSAVMWADAFLSAAVAVLSTIVSPVVAAVGMSSAVRFPLGVSVIALAGLLAACGAATFVMIAVRLRDGDDLLPVRLRLPLPAFLRPPLPGDRPDPRAGVSVRVG